MTKNLLLELLLFSPYLNRSLLARCQRKNLKYSNRFKIYNIINLKLREGHHISKFNKLQMPDTTGGHPHSDCHRFLNLHGLGVRVPRVQVRVRISVPVTFKTSPRISKTDGNWWRYGQNNRKHHLAHISVIPGPFWLILGRKTRWVVGKSPVSTGTGSVKKPAGYL